MAWAIRALGLKSELVWPWASYLTTPSFSFLIWKEWDNKLISWSCCALNRTQTQYRPGFRRCWADVHSEMEGKPQLLFAFGLWDPKVSLYAEMGHFRGRAMSVQLVPKGMTGLPQPGAPFSSLLGILGPFPSCWTVLTGPFTLHCKQWINCALRTTRQDQYYIMLYSRNGHNTVNQLYSHKNFKKEKALPILPFFQAPI